MHCLGGLVLRGDGGGVGLGDGGVGLKCCLVQVRLATPVIRPRIPGMSSPRIASKLIEGLMATSLSNVLPSNCICTIVVWSLWFPLDVPRTTVHSGLNFGGANWGLAWLKVQPESMRILLVI